jgi:hypothetical protein
MTQLRNLRTCALAALAMTTLSGCSMLGLGDTVTYKTVQMNGDDIKLAQFNTIEDGHKVRCSQFLESMARSEDNLSMTATIGTKCRRL